MKIAINTLSENPWAPSGAFEYYRNLILKFDEILSKNDELYVFLSKGSNKYFGPYNNPGIHKIIFPFSNERKLLRVLTEHFLFPIIIIKYRIDVLNTGTAILYCPCELIATLKTMHVFTNPKSLGILTRLYRKSVYWLTRKQASVIISNSIHQTNDINKYIRIEKSRIELVYEGIDHNLFTPRKDSDKRNSPVLKKYNIKKPYILFVSSLYKYKNAETLIDAFVKLASNIKDDLELVIAGHSRDVDYYQFLKSLVRIKRLENNIIFTGGVNHTDVAVLYQNALLFVYPSYYETFGLTILEAMACGCPVIASNSSSIPEIGSCAAIYFASNNSNELKNIIENLIVNQSERERHIKLGLYRSHQFSWEKTAQDTYTIFKAIGV